jgi:DNA-binding CsgD family transcriptional regulator
VVPCDVAIDCENNFRTKASKGFSDRRASFDEADARVYARYAHESPLIRAYRRGKGSAVKYSDFFTRREFHRTGLYNEFFRKRGTEFRKLPPPATPLVVEREGACLVVRLVFHNTHRLLILQRRVRTVTTPSLKPLGLSRREAQVMTWIAQGKTNVETALILQISRRTVDKHLEHIYTKLGVETRMAAAARVRAAAAGEGESPPSD